MQEAFEDAVEAVANRTFTRLHGDFYTEVEGETSDLWLEFDTSYEDMSEPGRDKEEVFEDAAEAVANAEGCGEVYAENEEKPQEDYNVKASDGARRDVNSKVYMEMAGQGVNDLKVVLYCLEDHGLALKERTDTGEESLMAMFGVGDTGKVATLLKVEVLLYCLEEHGSLKTGETRGNPKIRRRQLGDPCRGVWRHQHGGTRRRLAWKKRTRR